MLNFGSQLTFYEMIEKTKHLTIDCFHVYSARSLNNFTKYSISVENPIYE